jgi:hypothetical protein
MKPTVNEPATDYCQVSGSKTTAKTKAFYLFALSVLSMGCWLYAGLWSSSQGPWLAVLSIAAWLFISTLALAAARMRHSAWIYACLSILAALLILASLFLPASLLSRLPRPQGLEPFSSQQARVLLLMLSVALVTVALLLHSGLKLLDELRNTGASEGRDSPAQRKRVGKTALLLFALGSFLLAKALHDLYWFTVWDATTDSLGYIWLAIPVPVALLSGVVLCITLPGRKKLAGFLYALFVPALMIGVSAYAQRVDFHQLTEERAERITQAIETYYAREGRYPQNLRQLTPWYILSLPGPVILYGQDWCYQGGIDDYRLGYLDREHWSSPILFGRVYSAQGHSPLRTDICQPAIDTYRAQHPAWDRVLQEYGRPTPTPDMRD